MPTIEETLQCIRCGAAESTTIFPMAGGRGSGETTIYGAYCSECRCYVMEGLPSNTDGKKASAVREYKRELTGKKPTVRQRRSPYTEAQRAWCEFYRRETGCAPMMDAFESGKMTFDEAATRSIRWYESHTSDVHLRIQRAMPPTEV